LDRNVSSALLAALNHDPNVNVRLSAVDALEKFASDASIRAALVDSIAVQESPLVQISLIDALVQIADRDSAPELRRIAADEQVNSNVRGRARWALKNFGLQ
jgi:HEAT repeat protein